MSKKPTTKTSKPAIVQLSTEDSRALRDAGRVRRDAGIAFAAARARHAEAQLAYQQVLERIAEQHDFDPATPMEFDDRAHTLKAATTE